MTSLPFGPENLDLVTVAEFSRFDLDFDHDRVVVFKDKDGHYYLAADFYDDDDIPFELVKSINDLDGPFNFHEVIREMEKLVDSAADVEKANVSFALAVDSLINDRQL